MWLRVPEVLREAGVSWSEWVAFRWRCWRLGVRPLPMALCSWCGKPEFIFGRRFGNHRDCPPF